MGQAHPWRRRPPPLSLPFRWPRGSQGQAASIQQSHAHAHTSVAPRQCIHCWGLCVACPAACCRPFRGGLRATGIGRGQQGGRQPGCLRACGSSSGSAILTVGRRRPLSLQAGLPAGAGLTFAGCAVCPHPLLPLHPQLFLSGFLSPPLSSFVHLQQLLCPACCPLLCVPFQPLPHPSPWAAACAAPQPSPVFTPPRTAPSALRPAVVALLSAFPHGPRVCTAYHA